MDADALTAIMAQLAKDNLQLTQSITDLTHQVNNINQQRT